ncbi:hypothetical protein BFJ69_g15251 [Fusarium oxysporum]|uniref:Uncharacterized protein n=1 Tax=Fusarium oxysporum TaxID=5507 RepID=A0A420MEU9_FUSOX|nr:hypothetical protein BFJ69_g15251 [Fusarium oxysporum]
MAQVVGVDDTPDLSELPALRPRAAPAHLNIPTNNRGAFLAPYSEFPDLSKLRIRHILSKTPNISLCAPFKIPGLQETLPLAGLEYLSLNY